MSVLSGPHGGPQKKGGREVGGGDGSEKGAKGSQKGAARCRLSMISDEDEQMHF